MSGHRIVLTGGGTGGHIYPALSVAEQLKTDPEVEAILYIGAQGHLEERLAAERGLDFVGLAVSGMPRKLSPKLLSWPFQTLWAVNRARAVLKEFRPTVVLGTGGYASSPPLAAAMQMGVPYAVHEPDAHPGLVNRMLGRNANLVSLGMEGAKTRIQTRGTVIVNGNPVRQSFVNLMGRDAAAAILGLRADLKTVLITGGSQGARALNDAVIEALPVLLESEPHLQLIHQVGDKNFNEVKDRAGTHLQNQRYHLRAYFDDLAVGYAACDVAVCRAGAMTIAELAVTATPAIFIPFPFAAQDHQTKNAQYVKELGAAEMIVQSDLTAERLSAEILALVNDDNNSQRLRSMKAAMQALGKPQAAVQLAAQIKELSAEYQRYRRGA